ncbi:DegV family protein [Companilactobacillus zhachilii]|jgi:EDD domain protein, DegV family|uniref:DegV family protein n=1 Tax=Companilactobacillus zhachilii TaxID=2304606 RepID=A0A386PPE7_9LACO|nr:DegV family protein [Companilactobacillus zhachilii]AYE37444.1 DegV family protein [Companilactobacillus zhachilii]MBL3530966.1 DegV family protein [Companilactobacillus zhachilii]
MEKIAVLVDSCCDLPKEYLDKTGIYELPMQIAYHDKTYRDRIEISAEEVYQNLPIEIPKTSLPSGDSIQTTLDQIAADGYDHIVSISVSSSLSGTFNFLKVFLDEDDRFKSAYFDTKQVAVAAGLIAVGAKNMIDDGKDFADVTAKVAEMITNTIVYFCIPTLTYLRAGGRISATAAAVGGMLKLAPIITCKADGSYTIAAKARGMKKGQKMMLGFAQDFLGDDKDYLLAVGHGADEAGGQKMLDLLHANDIHGQQEFLGQVGPALGVHTGPGLVGIGMVKI